jgi:hypothetical protein
MSGAKLVWRGVCGLGLALGMASCSSGDNATTPFDSLGETEGLPDSGSTSRGEETGAGPTSTSDGDADAGQEVDTGLDDGPGETGDDDGCQSSDECNQPSATVCDTETGQCVGCTAAEDPCLLGTYCDPDAQLCIPGCIDDSNCGGNLICDVANNQCTGCVQDGDCPAGTLCNGGVCEPGCTPMHPCQPGLACCSGDCVDIDTDLDHCGGCNSPCDPDNAQGVCDAGSCDIDQCDQGFANCNDNIFDGCEVQGVCSCTPNEVEACYTGPPGTEGVGLCSAGTRTCNAAGTQWGSCTGQVLPSPEVCNSGQDENCNGIIDENPDVDQDGWGVCDGDCCDDVGPGCLNPALVNPGAFEYPGNGVDDDCDGVIDNALPSCDMGLASNSANADDYARAINLCQFTIQNPPLPERIWGVIQANLHRANAAGLPNANSRSIRPNFAAGNPAQEGERLVVLSSGHAAASGQTNPNFASFQQGQNMNTSSAFPADWLTANGGSLPNAPGCPNLAGNTAYDPVMLRLQVRVPTNAQSFTVRMNFFSAEYPEYVCTAFNDFFVTLIDSTAANNPPDKNIAVYDDGNNLWPVGVNILMAANGLFTQCQNGGISQCGGGGNYNACVGTAGLNNTGMHLNASACGHSGMTGGGTGWLTISGNVTPGEDMILRFVIWDTGDQFWDSVVLLDDFQWDINPSEPGIIIPQ